MEWGPVKEKLLEMEGDGEEVECLTKLPLLTSSEQNLYEAFTDLCATRNSSMGVAPILNSEIEAWLNIHSVVIPEDREIYYRAIRFLDIVWMRSASEKLEQIQKP